MHHKHKGNCQRDALHTEKPNADNMPKKTPKPPDDIEIEELMNLPTTAELREKLRTAADGGTSEDDSDQEPATEAENEADLFEENDDELPDDEGSPTEAAPRPPRASLVTSDSVKRIVATLEHLNMLGLPALYRAALDPKAQELLEAVERENHNPDTTADRAVIRAYSDYVRQMPFKGEEKAIMESIAAEMMLSMNVEEYSSKQYIISGLLMLYAPRILPLLPNLLKKISNGK